jgi:hypothetical protein
VRGRRRSVHIATATDARIQGRSDDQRRAKRPAFAQNVRGGPYELRVEPDPVVRLATAFNELQATPSVPPSLPVFGVGVGTSWNEVSAVRSSSRRFSPAGTPSVTHAKWRDAVTRSLGWNT